MTQENVYMVILQETKVNNGVYARDSAVFCVVPLDAPICHRGGVALLYKGSPHFVVEAYQYHGPNAIIFQLVMGG